MLLTDLIRKAKSELKNAGIDSYNIDCRVIISSALNLSKEDFIFKADTIKVSELELAKINDDIKRRINREPVSHITNNREFYGLDFFVNCAVLDPRPDSEILVQQAIAIINNLEKPITMAEIGVGSGCLSIAIAKNCSNVKSITASDISAEALEICQKNVASHNLTAYFKLINGNLMDDFDKNDQFSVIISNPPYIKTADIDKLQIEVKKFEPISALDGGIDGLDYYRKIATQAKNFLTNDGFLLLEIGHDQRQDVITILSDQDYKNIRHFADYGDNDRLIIAQR